MGGLVYTAYATSIWGHMSAVNFSPREPYDKPLPSLRRFLYPALPLDTPKPTTSARLPLRNKQNNTPSKSVTRAPKTVYTASDVEQSLHTVLVVKRKPGSQRHLLFPNEKHRQHIFVCDSLHAK